MKLKEFSSKNGFTLIEIMVAMAIFMVVVGAIYSSWTSIVRGSRAGQVAAAEAQRSRIAIRTIEDALLTTQLYTENIQHYSFIADTSDAKFAWLSFVARLPGSFPGSGLFGDSVVRRVTFSVEPGDDGTNKLVMTQIPLLLVTNSEVSAYPITLAKDVSLFVLEFWDTQLNDWTDELQTTNAIPKMVRVTLGVGSSSKFKSEPVELVSRVVSMPSLAVGSDVQRPTRQAATGIGGSGGGPGGIGGRGGKNGNNGNSSTKNGAGGNSGIFSPGGPNNGSTGIRQIPDRSSRRRL